MTSHPSRRAFASGVLAANALPHAHAAAVGATHPTPLSGRDSGPVMNALWSALNLAGAVALAGALPPKDLTVRRAFVAGAAAFVVWALVWEWTAIHAC